MADTDDHNLDAPNVQADAGRAKRTMSKGKGALRRKVADRGQTSLSSPIVLPAAAQLSDMLDAAHADEPVAIAPAVDPSLVEAALATSDGIADEQVHEDHIHEDHAPFAFVEDIGMAIDHSDSSAQPVVTSAVADEPIAAEALVTSPEPAGEPVAAASEVATPEAITPRLPTQSSVFSIKDMTMDMSANFNGFQGAMSEAQAKAQAAFEKSSSMLTEAGEFTKGNVEAMIESSKIFAEGVKGMGSDMVSESRTAFETMTGDIKELAAVKSPTDFFKLQSEMVRKNFDNAVAQSSKNTETLLKLMSDAFAPMSGRVSLAVEKARQVVPMNTAAPMTANV